jgi:hypothetical protein
MSECARECHWQSGPDELWLRWEESARRGGNEKKKEKEEDSRRRDEKIREGWGVVAPVRQYITRLCFFG